MSPMSYSIEVETGTYTGTRRRHNGYSAGGFSRTPMASPEQLAAIARRRPPTFPTPHA
jgi:hypothetical protein